METEKEPIETEEEPMETENKPMDFPYIADSKEVILAWGAQPAFGKPDGYCRNFEYTNGENHVIVLLDEYGSGRYITDIHIFGKSKEMKEWHWILSRPTNTSAMVEVHQEGSTLIFKTGDVIGLFSVFPGTGGNVLLELSLDTLGPFGKTEKKPMEFPPYRFEGKEAILDWGKQHNCKDFR